MTKSKDEEDKSIDVKNFTMKDVYLKRLRKELGSYEDLLSTTSTNKKPNGVLAEVIRICYEHFEKNGNAISAIGEYCGCSYQHAYNTCHRELKISNNTARLVDRDSKAMEALQELINDVTKDKSKEKKNV